MTAYRMDGAFAVRPLWFSLLPSFSVEGCGHWSHPCGVQLPGLHKALLTEYTCFHPMLAGPKERIRSLGLALPDLTYPCPTNDSAG